MTAAIRKSRFMTHIGAAFLSVATAVPAYAEETAPEAASPAAAAPVEAPAEPAGLVEHLFGVGHGQPLEKYGLKWGGWINGSITYNATDPADRFNGPVTFGDRSGEPQLNQFNLWLQKAVTASSDAWDFGFRVDFLAGSDAIFTQAYGVPATDLTDGRTLNRGSWDLDIIGHDERFYSIALPQVYGEFNVPIGNGLDVKVGHFYTPIGYEVVTAPDNFFFTKPYTFQYGEPFTHTGILASYTLNDNWSAMAGALTGSATGGWDGNFDQQLGSWSFIGGGTWTSTDKNYSLNLTTTLGPRSEKYDDLWALYSIVGKANFLDNKLHYVFQHDHGFADNVITGNGGPGSSAEWYGINQYLMYDLKDDLSVGVRGEWFRDADGFRVAGPARCGAGLNVDGDPATLASYSCRGNYAAYPFAGDNFYEVTVGMTYKPVKWITLRPNVRYDWTDKLKIFDTGTRTDQLTFSADFVMVF
jgi:hypothetical protein